MHNDLIEDLALLGPFLRHHLAAPNDVRAHLEPLRATRDAQQLRILAIDILGVQLAALVFLLEDGGIRATIPQKVGLSAVARGGCGSVARLDLRNRQQTTSICLRHSLSYFLSGACWVK